MVEAASTLSFHRKNSHEPVTGPLGTHCAMAMPMALFYSTALTRIKTLSPLPWPLHADLPTYKLGKSSWTKTRARAPAPPPGHHGKVLRGGSQRALLTERILLSSCELHRGFVCMAHPGRRVNPGVNGSGRPSQAACLWRWWRRPASALVTAAATAVKPAGGVSVTASPRTAPARAGAAGGAPLWRRGQRSGGFRPHSASHL